MVVENEKKEETPEEVDPIKKAEEVVKKLQDLTSRGENLLAKQILGGKAIAGEQPEQPKVETPREYVDRVMKTGKA